MLAFYSTLLKAGCDYHSTSTVVLIKLVLATVSILIHSPIGKECLACQYYSTPRRELFKELTDYPMIVTAFYIKEDTPLLEMALDR